MEPWRKRGNKILESKKMEKEPAYRLGEAISIIQCFLGTDSLSQQSEDSRAFVAAHRKKWAQRFMEKEKKFAEELSTA